MKYSSRRETIKHIRNVRRFIFKIIVSLFVRALTHDKTKLQKYEKKGFDEYTPRLAGMTYGSEEYKQCLLELKPYLDHHYAVNRHHPEHFELGLQQMNLVDVIEMFCDWYAATKRHKDGDIIKSIQINQKRFNYSRELKRLFINTYIDFFREE